MAISACWIIPGLRRLSQLPEQPSERQTGAKRPASRLPLPERQPGSLRRNLRHYHSIPVLADDLPCKRSKHKLISNLGFIHELLIQFSQLHSILRLRRVEPLIRDGTSCRDSQHTAVGVTGHPLMNPVIDHPRTHRNLSSVLVITSQHPQHAFYVLSRHIAKGISPAQNIHHIVHAVPVACRHGHQMLGKHIETEPRRLRMLDSAQSGDLGSHAAVDALRGCPGIHIHHADRPRIMARPAQPLHRTGNRARTADLQNLVYLTHIDPQLHGGGCAQKPEPSFSQVLLYLRPLFLRKTSVMNSGKPVTAQQVDVIGQLFRIPASFRKCNHASAVQTLLINRHPQFFPDRILPSPVGRSRSHHLN